MSSEQDWTGPWIAEKMREHQNVKEAIILTPRHVRIIRKRNNPVLVGTVSEERLEAKSLEPIFQASQPVDFVVNVPKEAYVMGDALEMAERTGIPIGGLGDLMRAMSLADVRKYVDPEMTFVLRGLRQHDRIDEFHRVADRSFIIERTGLEEINVVFLNEYDLTADHVRTAYDRYGPFQLLVITNPNGRATAPAEEVAQRLNVEIHKWGAFYGRLNKR